MSSVVDARIKALERQIETLKMAISQPRGLFETLDQMIKNFRMANRETLRSIGFKAQAGNLARASPLNLSLPVLKRARKRLINLR